MKYREKNLLMMWRAITLAAIAIIICGIFYVVYSTKKQQEVWLYFDEEGFAYDKTCLEQKVFVKIMNKKMSKPREVQTNQIEGKKI